MDAKEVSRDIWGKIRQWGRARLDELTPLDMLALAINPPRKDKLLDEEEEYAVALIAAALAEQEAEIARLREAIKTYRHDGCVPMAQAILNHGSDEIMQTTREGWLRADSIILAALLPPDEPKEVQP